MEPGMVVALAGLALIDSTSLGTLLLPIWMMLSPRLRMSRFLTYLGTVTGFYFALGVVLVVGAGALQQMLVGLDGSATAATLQLVAGAALFALSFRYDTKRPAARQARRGGADRAQRLQAKLVGEEASTAAMIALGLAAAGVEAVSMVPYLAAVGMMTAADLGVGQWLPLLLGYVAVMVLPALVLAAARSIARRRVEPALHRLSAWMSRHSADALGWTLGVVGFLLAADAASRLFSSYVPGA